MLIWSAMSASCIRVVLYCCVGLTTSLVARFEIISVWGPSTNSMLGSA